MQRGELKSRHRIDAGVVVSIARFVSLQATAGGSGSIIVFAGMRPEWKLVVCLSKSARHSWSGVHVFTIRIRLSKIRLPIFPIEWIAEQIAKCNTAGWIDFAATH